MAVKAGSSAPDFELEDKDGKNWSLEDFGKKVIVLYFYPKDNTEGCTVEANEFTKKLGGFHKAGAEVIGISGGDKKSKEKFCSDNKLRLLLLSDSDFSVCRKYGVYEEKQFMGKKYMGIFRTTFVISDMKIIKVFENVKVKGHVEEVLGFVKNC